MRSAYIGDGGSPERGRERLNCPLLAPRREQNLVTFLDTQAEHRLQVGREGRRTQHVQWHREGEDGVSWTGVVRKRKEG